MNRLLQDKRVDPSAQDNYAISRSARFGHLNIVNRLLQDEKVDPSAQDNYAIRYGARNGHVDVVYRLLQDERVDPSAQNNYAIFWSAEKGHSDVVKLLLQDNKIELLEYVDKICKGEYIDCIIKRAVDEILMHAKSVDLAVESIFDNEYCYELSIAVQKTLYPRVFVLMNPM